MTLITARVVSLVLMIAAFPLISAGTTADRAGLWILGLVSLVAGAAIPPALRFFPPKAPEDQRKHAATDLGESSRVC